ncbi:MAG: DUF3037 domain-containing protein [Pseudomonadota bacterium]
MRKAAYTYCILRYHHDPFNGEALNVGVLIWCRKLHFLEVKVRHGDGRILSAYPNLDRTAVTSALRRIRDQIAKVRHASGPLFFESTNLTASDFARDVLKHDDSSLQWGNSGAGLTEDPATELEHLYQRFVARFENSKERTLRTDEDVWRPVREMMESAHIANEFADVEVSSALINVHFKAGYQNGELHCVEPLSFDLTDDERITEKASRWTGRLHNLEGSEVQFKPYFVVGRPTDDRRLRAFDRAVKILRQSPHEPVVFEEGQANELVEHLEDLVKAGHSN